MELEVPSAGADAGQWVVFSSASDRGSDTGGGSVVRWW